MKSKNPFTHCIRFTLTKNNSDFMDWLVSQWGPGGIQADSKWYIKTDEMDYGKEVIVCFRNDQAASLFALRWL